MKGLGFRHSRSIQNPVDLEAIDAAFAHFCGVGNLSVAIGNEKHSGYALATFWRKTGIPARVCKKIEIASKGVITADFLRKDIEFHRDKKGIITHWVLKTNGP